MKHTRLMIMFWPPVLCLLASLPAAAQEHALPLDESPAEPGSWGFRPGEDAAAATNPPAFSWRPVPEASEYVLEVSTAPEFEKIHYTARTPWSAHCPDTTFPEGAYYWRYAARDAAGQSTPWSTPRAFSIAAGAPALPKPGFETLAGRIPEQHPRLFMRPEELADLQSLAAGELAPHWQQVLAQADQLLETPPDIREPPKYPADMTQRDGEWKKIWWGNRRRAIALTDGAATLAFAYRLSGEEKYGRGARDLLMAFCAWDPKGATQYDYNDEAAMPLLYFPSRAYTWAYDALSEDDRARIRDIMAVRGADVYQRLRRGTHLWTPYNSHDNRAWHWLGELAIAFQGEIPEARTWLDYITTIYYVCYPVWGGNGGGWSEGTAYWVSYLDRFMSWVLVSQAALGVNPFEKPFFHQTGYFGLYTLPPGTQAGAWGDQGNLHGSERAAPLMAKLAIGAQNPHWWWYAQEHEVDLSTNYFGFLYSARGGRLEARAPVDLPSSRSFEDIGVAVLNTNLLDGRENVQIHFKSSPFGRQSHGYNSNNAFMLYWNGKPVLTLTGRRDVSGSAHHKEWIWETKSDNAILVNGLGQEKGPNAHGRISAFKATPHVDYVSGEAADAYGGRLRRWTRRILFFKPSLVVLHDVLEAPEAARYQWLLHAQGPFTLGEQEADWKGEQGTLKVRFLAPQGLQLRQTDQYSTPPADWSNFKLDEWHLTAETGAPAKNVQFVTVLQVGAEQPAPSLEVSGEMHRLQAEVEGRSYTISLSPDAAEVEGPELRERW